MARTGLISLRLASPAAPATPVSPGSSWGSFGDSQSAGYGTGTSEDPMTAFRNIWDQDFTPPTTYVLNGSGGRALAATNAYYTTRAERTGFTFVHFQESGDQAETGQTTASEFGDTYDDFITEIQGNTPNAVKLSETAFNFGRGPEGQNDPNRDWGPYNTELRARIATWAGSGVTIYLAEVDRNIKALDLLIPGDVWFSSVEANSYHYKDAGNLMVALSYFDTLNYDVTALDLSGITNVTAPQKAACLQVIAAYQ
jgi:hypothetical protein